MSAVTTFAPFTASTLRCDRCKRLTHPDELIAPAEAHCLRICLRCVEDRRVP